MSFLKQMKSQNNVLNFPNCLTIFRIVTIPLIAYLLDIDTDQLPFHLDSMSRFSPGKIAAIVVAIAGITDLLDGYYARKWNIESLLGKFLDPVADKLFLLVSLVMLMKLGRVEAWLVIVLLSREFLITALRAVAAGEGLIIAAGQSGKVKLTFQMIGLGFLMWYGTAFGLSAVKVGSWILYIALFASLFSGYHYLVDFLSARRAKNTL
ncbi:CDP-diacylglycerol--glycerol-3-phosphate 3-phosphatidyltransferase [bacterium]|nr:CDP-diacylglycerol--glycerol-3-phosphate 3-phosphatidyltransferase [bacterium]